MAWPRAKIWFTWYLSEPVRYDICSPLRVRGKHDGIADARGPEAVRLITRVKKPQPACQTGRVLSVGARSNTADTVSVGSCWRSLADRPRSSALPRRSAVGARHGCSWDLAATVSRDRGSLCPCKRSTGYL